jgi:F5/8 type C domain
VSCCGFERARAEGRTGTEVEATGTLRLRQALGILCAYLLLAAIYAYPVLQKSHTGIANDPYDPILNTSILWWNATTIPFSTAWWSPPHFYPSRDVAAFTENLVGISLFATPIYWLTGSALAAYNLSFFLTWPLSAFGAYLLTWFIVRRHDAAFLAGLAYGFTPYRTSELGHLQMLSVYWMPVAILALHGFLSQRRGRWLLLFGIAWVLQALANGYFIFFGAVLIGLWLLYFCTSRDSWRAAPAIVMACVLANLALTPIMWKYHVIHQQYGLRRSMAEALAFSAPASGWIEVSQVVWFWPRLLPESDDNLFPGITAVLLVLAGIVVGLKRARHTHPWSPTRRVIVVALSVVAAISFTAMLVTILLGPWSREVLGITFRMTDLDRAVGVAIFCSLLLVFLIKRIRAALARRSVFMFYTVATILLGMLCCGPVLRTGDVVILEPMPYRWLMYLPGFDSLRVPTRFWMLGTLCLGVAAGISFARYGPTRIPVRRAVFALAVAGFLLDGWTRGIGMAEPPQQWPKVERRDRMEPIIELPLGPSWDAAGTFRAMRHRRPVVNGVSGFDPPHYAPLQDGLNAYDPSVLLALSSLSAIDVVVNGAADPDGAWARYASTVGGEPIATDGTRRLYRIPFSPVPEVVLGAVVPITAVSASSEGFEAAVDGKLETEWHDNPRQLPGHFLAVDLGTATAVGGAAMSLGEFARDFPRRLAIETSLDGVTWQAAWEGRTVSMTILAAVRAPRECTLRFSFAAREARHVRFLTLEDHKNLWRVAELTVHAP